MFIFGVDSTLWLTGLADSCGLFACSSNAYRRINNVSRPYAEFVGSRTIIGYILPLLEQVLLV